MTNLPSDYPHAKRETDESVRARSFIGIRGRTFETQQAALAGGYSSTVEWAIDHLAARVIELEARIDALESDAQG